MSMPPLTYSAPRTPYYRSSSRKRRTGAPSPSAAPSGRPRRIVLYSHDTQGLGHMRRNLLIAQTLLQVAPRPNILLIGGARELGALTIPPGIDCVTLPALSKSADGTYHPRSLNVSLRRIIALRSGAITAALQSFDPDVFIVDKTPLGAFDELKPGLEWLRARNKARIVLGLRDILDEPAVARREWARSGATQAIRRYYAAVWVYGDPQVFDPAAAYGFSRAVTRRLVYTGYIDRSRTRFIPPDENPAHQYSISDSAQMFLCLVGGGQDGFTLAAAFARTALPEGSIGVIVTGPFMPVEAREKLAVLVGGRPDLRLLHFIDEPTTLMQRAAAVVIMGGYNTVCEALAHAKPALIVPRVRPRCEQLIRAERMRALGLADLLHPDALSPDTLSEWLHRPHPPTAARQKLDLGALERLPRLVDQLFAAPEQAQAALPFK
jgi:predicted glycosyltransferase